MLIENGFRLLKHHSDEAANDHGIDAGVVDVLAEKVDVTLEPKARDHVVHSIEAAQNGALAATRGTDEAGDRTLWDRDAAVAHCEEIAVKDFADVAVDRCFGRSRHRCGRSADIGLGCKHGPTSRF
jgi:hypothetical protein